MVELDDIYSEISKELKTRFELVMSICNSPIEKLFIAHIYRFFFIRRFPVSILSHDAQTLLIEKNINAESYNRGHDYYKGDDKVGHYVHPLYGTLEKISGISIRGIDINYDIYPQKPVFDNEKLFYVDFAIIIKNKNNKVIAKFVIECDGFEWHSTKEQLTRDNLRNRFLTMHGYKIIRYTGQEINRFTEKDILKLENTIYHSIFGQDSHIYKWETF